MTRTERTYYLVFGCYSLAAWFIAPVYPLFLLSRGLDLFQTSAVLAVYLTVVFLFEVPTGAVADVAGRKLSFVASCFVRAVAYGMYAFATTFTDCVIAEAVDAFGTTLASGAIEAWAIDGAREEGDLRPADRLLSRAQAVSGTSMVLGGILAGYLAARSWSLTWAAGSVGFLATAALGVALMRDTRPRTTAWSGVHRSLGRTAAEAVALVRTSPVLLALCLLSFTLAFGGLPVIMLWQKHLLELGGSGLPFIGWTWAWLGVAVIAGSTVVPRLVGFGRERVLCVASLVRAVGIAGSAVAGGVWTAIVFLLVYEIAWGATDPLANSWVNEHVGTERRATVLSVRSAFMTLGGAMGLLSFGLVARAHGIPPTWLAIAVLFAGAAPGYVLLGRATATAGRADVGVAPAPLAL
jgi:MFS family permease